MVWQSSCPAVPLQNLEVPGDGPAAALCSEQGPVKVPGRVCGCAPSVTLGLLTTHFAGPHQMSMSSSAAARLHACCCPRLLSDSVVTHNCEGR